MTDVPVAWTKVVVPGRNARLLSRQRLLDLLYELLEQRLIIVAAPAGYGKTTLLVDFARRAELTACWLSLDELDQSPRRFLAGFIAALTKTFPDFGKQARATLQTMATEIDWDAMVTAVVNDAYENIGEHFVFVLDDYHSVDDVEGIVYFVNRFIQQVDENCHLVLLTRKLPALPDLPLMVARGQVSGLGFQALAFRRQEVQELMLQNYSLTLHGIEANLLVERTEGWITGLLLSAQTMGFNIPEQARVTQVSGVGLYDYLAQQVLERQSEEMRQFLLHSSLLDEFNAEICAEVLEPATYLGPRSWRWFIGDAERRNLFIQPVDERSNWVRYHQLFREFLRKQMSQQYPDETRRVREQLAAYYRRRGEWDRAYQLYEMLEEIEKRAALIEEAGPSMSYAGRQETLARWIDDLPRWLVESWPEILSLRGTVAADLGDAETGVALLDEAHAVAVKQGDQLSQARTLVRRAGARRLLGRREGALADAEAALVLMGEGEGWEDIYNAALRAVGLARHHMGQLPEAIEALQEARLLEGRRGNRRQVALISVDLGSLFLAVGETDRAREAFEESLRYWRESGNLRAQANVLNNLGVIYHTQGDYEKAGTFLEEAVELAEKSGFQQPLALTMAGIGDLYADLDAFEAAWDAYESAGEVAKGSDYRFIQIYVQRMQAALARRRGNLRQADRLLEGARSGGVSADWQLEAGRLALVGGDVEEAVALLAEAVAGFDAHGRETEAEIASLDLAATYHERGEGEERARALARAGGGSDEDRPQAAVVAARQQKAFIEEMIEAGMAPPGTAKLLAQVEAFEARAPALRRTLRRTMATVPFPPPRVNIRLLGEPEVSLGGEAVTRSDWQTPMAPSLLYLLLANPEGLTKEEIGGFLWPDHSPGRLKVNFQKTIYRLRRALAADVVVYDGDTYQYRFNRALDYWYDVELFQQRLLDARTASDSAEQKAAYQEAIELYRGQYLVEEDGIWAWPIREALAAAYRKAALELAELWLHDELYDQVLKLCRRLLAEDRCLEEAHRLAMRAHAGRGSVAGVVRQYDRCRQALEEEIHVAPSEPTEELYELLVSAA